LVVLDTKFERLEDNKVKFDITIDADTVDAAIDSVYRETNKNARIPGFRKGRAPRTVLQHTFGEQYFTAYATENLIEKYSPEAVDSADFIALRDYDYDTDDKLVEEGQDYTYSFTILVKPQMELTSTDPVEVTLKPLTATEDEINQQIDTLRSYYIDLKPVTDRPVQNDDIVVYSQECEINGEAIEEAKEDKRTYVVGAGSSSKEFDEQIIGMSIGETKDFVLQSTELGIDDKYSTVPVTAKVTVNEITEKAMPELTDEWAKNNCDVENVEALRKQVAEGIEADKQQNYERDKSIACLDALAERIDGEIPREVIEDATTTALRNFYMNLQNQGFTLDQYLMATGQSADSFYNDMQEQGEELAKQNMALDALARHLELEVTDEDIDEAFAEADTEDKDALRKQWEDDHRMAVLREEILRDKAAKQLYADAKVTFSEDAGEDDEEAPATEEAAAEEPAAAAEAAEAPADEAATEE